MITVHAVSLSCIDPDAGDFGRLVDLVDVWLAETFPYDGEDGFAPGIALSSRHEPDNGVFRVTVTDSSEHVVRVENTTVTVVNRSDRRGGRSLTFDVRVVIMPAADRVAPRSRRRIQPGVLRLLRDALDTIEFRDAEQRVLRTPMRMTTEMEGQSLAALALLNDARRLPIIVEVLDGPAVRQPLFDADLGPLTGLAHVVHLASPEALAGYRDLGGSLRAGTGDVIVHWAGVPVEEIVPLGPLPADAADRTVMRIVDMVLDAATRSLPPPRVPAARTEDIDDDEESEDAPDPAEAVMLQAQVAELQAALETADAIIEEQRDKLGRRDDQFNQMVLQMVNQQLSQTDERPPQVRSMRDVIDKTQKFCSHLVLHPTAVESALELQGPDPNLVLLDLIRLNRVAARWAAGDLGAATIAMECRREGLPWAAGISQTAVRKYGEDYTIEWRGKPVLAAGHIKRGKHAALYRIHVYFDPDTRETVVAHIGRHLRDAGAN